MKNNKVIGIAICTSIVGGIVGAVAGGVLSQKTIMDYKNRADKFKKYYNTLIRLFKNKHMGNDMEQYFINNGYKEIAIYGMGEMGRCLYEELKNSSISVKYAIDKNAVCMDEEIKIVEPTGLSEKVDVIVVSAIYVYDTIECELNAITDIPVISFDDILEN